MKVEGGTNWKESVEPVNSKTSSAEKLYLKCKECDKTFNTKSGFDRHLQHHTGQYSFFCEQCMKGFANSSNYKLHMRGHEGKGFPCEYCGKVFKSPQFKQYHESEHTGNYRFTCEKCKKGFNEKRHYFKHLTLH